MTKQELKRSRAVSFIEQVLIAVAKVKTGTADDVFFLATEIQNIARGHGLEFPEKCWGEAHTNAFIDNCNVCMGSTTYGFIAPHVKIK